MRIACPTCSTTYDVPDAALKPGRSVRCARCETQWEPPPVAAPAPQPTRAELETLYAPTSDELSAVGAPSASAMERLSVPGKPPQTTKALAAAWGLTAAVLIGLLAACVAGRHAVMAAWPPSTRLYGLIGLSGGPTAVPEVSHADPKG